jgi:hypothetical protein
LDSARLRLHEIIARRQAKDPIHTAIVGARSSSGIDAMAEWWRSAPLAIHG